MGKSNVEFVDCKRGSQGVNFSTQVLNSNAKKQGRLTSGFLDLRYRQHFSSYNSDAKGWLA